MKKIEFLDNHGTFRLNEIGSDHAYYFPLTGNAGLKSVITPDLNGDAKLDQNHFLLTPVSVEDLHNNKSGRNFWCRLADGSFFSAAGNSAGQQAESFTENADEVTVEGGVLWHRVKRRLKKWAMETEILSFVPAETDVEVMRVTVRNIGSEPRTFRPVGAIPLYGRSADNLRDHRHVTSLLNRITVTENGVCMRPTLSFDERGHKFNRHTYFVAGAEGDGSRPVEFFPVAGDFTGAGGSFEIPEAIAANLPGVAAGTDFEGAEALGGLGFAEKILLPGEEAVYLLFMGIADSGYPRLAAEIIREYGTDEKVMAYFRQSAAYWQEKNNITVQTGDRQFDHYLKWIGFQPVLRRIYGCSFLPHHDYGKGGRGWRDLWQDLLALMLTEPGPVGEMLYENFRGVRMDGSNATIIGSRPGEFIADRNNIVRVWMDHGLWPFMTTALYLHQTGDFALLFRETGYFKDRQVLRGTGHDEAYREALGTGQKTAAGGDYSGTVLEHILLQNLTAFYEAGEHGHLRLRGADWNDALDMAEERGESVAFSAAYAGNLAELAELLTFLQMTKGVNEIELLEEMLPLLQTGAELYGNQTQRSEILTRYCQSVMHTVSGKRRKVSLAVLRESLLDKAEWLKSHIREKEWLTAGWFNSYYDNRGRQAEGQQNGQAKMMLTGQVFAIMSDTATQKQTAAIIQNADTWLYRANRGGYCLNTDLREENEAPPQSADEVGRQLGRMFGFAYGHKENGAVFSHMAVMYGNALYKKGFAAAGYKALAALYRQAADLSQSRIYPGIPEYFDGRGRGLYHYLTGAASWYLLTVVTRMFGVRGHYGDLLLEPHLLPGQFDRGEASICLRFAGKKLRIIYTYPDDSESHVKPDITDCQDYRTKPDFPGEPESEAKQAAPDYHLKTCELNGRSVGHLIARSLLNELAEETEHIIRVTIEAVCT